MNEPVAAPPAWLSASLGRLEDVELFVRPLASGDAEHERSFIARLSQETMQQRVLGSIRAPSDEQIAQLLAQDWPRTLALAMFALDPAGTSAAPATPGDDAAPDDGAPAPGSTAHADAEIVAVARFGAGERPGTAEFAIVVADRWQNRGLGTRLMALMIRAARAAGYRQFDGTTFADNRAMIALARACGGEVGPEPGEPTLRRLRLPLDDAGPGVPPGPAAA